MGPLVFVVDGVPERRAVVEHVLLEAGYEVETFATSGVLAIAEQRTPAAMVVAIEFSNGNGIVLREKIRQKAAFSRMPFILLADNKRDKYRAAIDSDIDDCVSFPFAPGELVEVIEAALGRVESRASDAPTETFDLVIDPNAMKVFVRGKEIRTTPLEFRLIDYMAQHRGKVFTRDALLDAVWSDLQFVTPRSVDACIRRIRAKIGSATVLPLLFKTIRGIGYKLDAASRWEKGEDDCQCPTCCAARSRTISTSAPKIGSSGPQPTQRAASFN